MLGRSWGLRWAAVTAAVVAVLGGGVLARVPSASAALAGVPGAPGGVKAVAQNQGAVVSWTPPASTGGSPITGYVIKASPGGKSVKTSVVTSFLVGGLTNGTAYQLSVAAINKDGTGPASSLSAAVIPTAPAAPGVPRSVAAVAGFQQASVSWAAPVSNGGAPVTAYKISTSPATSVVSVAGSARSAVLAGLANGTGYQVLVAAVNSVGTGKAAASAAVTPHVTAPGVPMGVTAAPTTSGVRVGWQPPLSDGGSAVTGYVITVTGTSKTVTAAATAGSVTVAGLTAGTVYTFTVAATNAKGRGPSVTSTPATVGATAGSKTVVLDAASLATLTLVGTDGSLVFTSPTTQVSGITAGDVVVAGVSSATPAGLMVQVTSVTASGATLTLATTPASLDQALSAAGFGINSQLTQSQVTGFTAARAGVQLLPASSAPASASPGSITLSLNADLYKDSQGRAVSVAGNITLTPQMSFWASITCCVHTASTFTGTVTAAASLSLKAALSHDISGDITLGTLHFAPITITVAGVPVVILPTLTVKLTASGTITAGLSSGAGASITTGAKIATADSAVTVTPVFTRTASFAPITLYGKVEAAAGPEADLSATVDGLPGPDLTDTLSLPKLTADPAATPWWTLSAENVLALDYQLKLLDHLLASYHKTISDVTLPLAHAPSPYQQITITPTPAVTTPGGTLQLHAQVAGVASQAVAWNAPTGNGIITTTGLYTAPTTPGTYQITAAQPASGLKPPAYGLTSIQVGDQPPGPPTSPAATSASYGTAAISWEPPADTGGGPITRYTITAHPGGQSETASGSASGAIMTGLSPGDTYSFTITATNDGGTSLPSPATNSIVIDNVPGGGISGSSEALAVAGNGVPGFCYDGSQATGPCLRLPTSVAAAPDGTIYVADQNAAIFAVSPDGTIRRFAGNGTFGSCGDGGPAIDACLENPFGLVYDDVSHALYFIDSGEIRKVDSSGMIYRAMPLEQGCSFLIDSVTGDCYAGPQSLALDTAGDFYIGVTQHIIELTPNGQVTNIAGKGGTGYSFCGDGGPAVDACVATPDSIVIDKSGGIVFSDPGTLRVRRIGPDGIINTVAGGGTWGPGCTDSGPAVDTCIIPAGLDLDSSGNLYIGSREDSGLPGTVDRVDPAGDMVRIAGTDQCPATGCPVGGVLAKDLWVRFPVSLSLGPTGDLLVADADRAVVYRIAG